MTSASLEANKAVAFVGEGKVTISETRHQLIHLTYELLGKSVSQAYDMEE